MSPGGRELERTGRPPRRHGDAAFGDLGVIGNQGHDTNSVVCRRSSRCGVEYCVPVSRPGPLQSGPGHPLMLGASTQVQAPCSCPGASLVSSSPGEVHRDEHVREALEAHRTDDFVAYRDATFLRHSTSLGSVRGRQEGAAATCYLLILSRNI
jgi:hypothetical protein